MGIELIDNVLKADLSPKTKSNYQSGFNALEAKAGESIETILMNPKKYIPLIRKWHPKDTSYKVNLSFILGVFKYNKSLMQHEDIHEMWTKAFKDADKAVKERYETNAPSERQLEGYIPYTKIIKARDELPKGSVRRILLGMYTYFPPRRCEYARMAIYKSKAPPASDVEENYIVLTGSGAKSSGKMIINTFKTSKHHGKYEVAIPKELIEDIRTSLEESPREWLFLNAKSEPFTQKQYSNWTMSVFKSIFKKPLTVALVRHSFINSLDFNTLSIKEKKDIAHAMAHTIEMQDNYRLIFDDNKGDCDDECEAKKPAS
jgi:hypothetical protein